MLRNMDRISLRHAKRVQHSKRSKFTNADNISNYQNGLLDDLKRQMGTGRDFKKNLETSGVETTSRLIIILARAIP